MHVSVLAPALLAAGAVASGAKKDITIDGNGWSFPATMLTTGAPAPCVIFFAGSGPTDRDWLSPLLRGRSGSGKQIADALQARAEPAKKFTGRALVVSASKDAQVPTSDALSSPAARKTEVEIANANHVYKSETRGLAPGLVDAIAAFVKVK